MFAQLTRVTNMMSRFITTEIKCTQDMRQSGVSWVTKVFVPQVDCGCIRGEGKELRRAQGVELVGALISEEHRARRKVLYGKASGIKFNGNIIVTCKFANRD